MAQIYSNISSNKNNELQHRNLNSSIRNMQQQQKAKTKSTTEADY
jgi:hypothetical protein